MTDIVSDMLRAVLTAVLFVFAFSAGRRLELEHDPGWRLLTMGFGLLVFATIWDVTDNFDALSAYLVVGDTPLQSVLEKIVGYLGGFALLFAGFLRWLPQVGATKAARRELARLNTELEARVAERTAELERVSEAKSDFLARMSHELRTPLNAVIGLSEIMQRQLEGIADTERCAENAGYINASGRHLLAMVEEILDLSKIEAGQMRLEEDAVDLSRLGNEAVAMLQAEADKVGVTLEMHIDASLPYLRADEQRLRQILLNLLSNAIKFTPKGGRVTLGLGMDRDGQPRITVRDTGIGMSAEELARVRQPFVQGTQLEERRSPGTGLGLVLVEQLAELHGGAFTMESMPGKGTMASVTLPAERMVAKEAGDADTARISGGRHGASAGAQRERLTA